MKQVMFGLIATIISGTSMLFIERCFFSRISCPISSMNLSSANVPAGTTVQTPNFQSVGNGAVESQTENFQPAQENALVSQPTKPDTESTENPSLPSNSVSEKVTICHKGKKTVDVTQSEVNDHVNHGDVLGACVPKEKKPKNHDKGKDKEKEDKKDKKKGKEEKVQ